MYGYRENSLSPLPEDVLPLPMDTPIMDSFLAPLINLLKISRLPFTVVVTPGYKPPSYHAGSLDEATKDSINTLSSALSNLSTKHSDLNVAYETKVLEREEVSSSRQLYNMYL